MHYSKVRACSESSDPHPRMCSLCRYGLMRFGVGIIAPCLMPTDVRGIELSVRIARGTMSVLTVSGESMAPRALPLGPSWSRGHSGMLARPSPIRVHSAGGVGKVATTSRSCRCAAAETLSSSSAEPRVSPRECTYGALNVLWVASELKRLLTMQRNPGDGLVLTRGQWSWDIQQPRQYQFKGVMQFCNTSSRFELFVPEVSAKLQLLSDSSLASITATAQNTLTANVRRGLFGRQRVCNREMKSSAVAEPDFSEKRDETQTENRLPHVGGGKGDVGSTTMVNAALTSVLPESRSVHETAIVHPDAVIGEGVVIGAFCTVGPGVSIGYGCKLHPGSHVCGNTELGEGCEVMNGAVVGAEISGRTVLGNHNTVGYHAVVGVKCQDMKYKEGDECYLQIGNNNDIREYASIHRSSKPNDCTVIGDNNLIMGSCHVAHDCKLGNYNILANGTLIGGHVILEDYIHTGGAVAIHQHCHIDSYSFLAGGSMVTRDVPMYMMVSGDRAELRGLNLEGMRRLGFSELEVKSIRRTYQKLFMNSDPDAGGLEDRLADLEANEELAEVPAVVAMLRSVRNCFREKRRGICTFRHWTSV